MPLYETVTPEEEVEIPTPDCGETRTMLKVLFPFMPGNTPFLLPISNSFFASFQFNSIELNWNDAKKELEIGKRKGVFPGMKGKRTFNIVLVSPQSGVGISTSSSGVTVSYNGKATKLKIK